MNEVAEAVCHGVLEGGSNVFQAKGHDSICECASWGCECSLVTILVPDLNLVIPEKFVHEGKYLMSGTCIDNMIDEGCWEVVFGTCPIEIVEFSANEDGTLFFIHGNRIRNPYCVCNGINEADCA